MKPLRIRVFWILVLCSASCVFLRTSPAVPSAEAGSVVPATAASESIATEIPGSTGGAEIILHNGTVLTMDDANPSAQAVAILDDKILAVGANDEAFKFRGGGTAVIDLGGRTLLPGFIDSHTHRITQRYKWGFSLVEEAAQEALSQGWAGLSELAVNEEQFNELRVAAEQGALNIRVNVYLTANTFLGDPLPEWYNAYRPGQQFGPYLRIAGLKVFIDGDSGRNLYWDQEELNEFLRRRQSEGWQISMKAIGIDSHEVAISAFESLLQGDKNEAYRYRIEHSVAVNDDQLSRLAQTGIITAIQPVFPGVIWYLEDIRNLTQEEGPENMFRWPEYQKAGVIVAASPYNPDGTNEELTLPSFVSPMGLLYRSVTQIGLGDSLPEPWMLERTLTVEELLPLMTIRGAYANFEDDVAGSLSTGKLADMVILSENPLQSAPAQLKDIEVLMTMVGGSVEFCAVGLETLCPDASSNLSSSIIPLPQTGSGGKIIASSELTGDSATNAFDGNADSVWNSGKAPEQWIQIDLGAPRAIKAIRMQVAQYPEGMTIHQIWGGDSETSMILLHEFRGSTVDSQMLEFDPAAPLQYIRFLRILTTQSPSWVAWKEIEVIEP